MRLDNIIYGGRRSYQRMDQTKVGTGSNVLAPWDKYTKPVSRKIDDELITMTNRFSRFEKKIGSKAPVIGDYDSGLDGSVCS